MCKVRFRSSFKLSRKTKNSHKIKEHKTRSQKVLSSIICGALRDSVPFVQFKKREKHSWRSVNFSKVAGFTKINTPLWVFFTFLKLYKWYQIAQRITYTTVLFWNFVVSVELLL